MRRTLRVAQHPDVSIPLVLKCVRRRAPQATTDKPPAGVRAERLDLPTAKQPPGSPARSGGTQARAPAVSPALAAERAEVLDSFKNRECVIALEELDRKTSASEPTSAAELKRLQQTVNGNCSANREQRREQEDMAVRLRVRTVRPAWRHAASSARCSTGRPRSPKAPCGRSSSSSTITARRPCADSQQFRVARSRQQ